MELEQEVYDHKSRLGTASWRDDFNNLKRGIITQETFAKMSKGIALNIFKFTQMVKLEEVTLAKATWKILGYMTKEFFAGMLILEAENLERRALAASAMGHFWKSAGYVAGATLLRTGAAFLQASAQQELETDYLKEATQSVTDLTKEAGTSSGRTFGSATMPRVQNMIINVSMGFTGETILVGSGMSIEETSAVLTDLVIGGVSEALDNGEIAVPA